MTAERRFDRCPTVRVRRSWSFGCLLGVAVSLPLVVRAQETVTALQSISVSTTTGEKPQSKVWFHEGRWWTVLPSSSVSPSGTWLWRLESNNRWTNVLRLSSSTSTKADAKVQGDVTHILLHSSSPQLVSVEYVPGSATYMPWLVRPGATAVPLGGSETATIDIDTGYRMWAIGDSGSNVRVYYSDFPYTAFQGPVTLASNINSDDITAIVALPVPFPPRIGAFWSNQNTKRFGFRTHRDGDPPGTWSADELPASQSALNVGGGLADDHMNAAVGSDGTLYMAVKTSYNNSKFPQVALLVRRPTGRWDDLYQVDTRGTRGIVVLNEGLGFVRVIYTTDTSGGNIVYRDSFVSHLGFGSRRTLMTGSLNNATSTKENWSDQLVVIASGRGVLIREGSVATTTTTTTLRVTTTTVGPTGTTTSTTNTTTTLGGGTVVSATVNADVSVIVGNSTRYGTSAKLEVDNSPVKHAYLRFTVSGTAGRSVTRAVLRLHAASSSGADSDSKGRAHAASCAWTESTLSGTTQPQPAIDSAILSAPAGTVAQGELVEFDVTGVVTGDGTYCVAIDTTSSDGVDYNSREASSGKPTVVVTVAP